MQFPPGRNCHGAPTIINSPTSFPSATLIPYNDSRKAKHYWKRLDHDKVGLLAVNFILINEVAMTSVNL